MNIQEAKDKFVDILRDDLRIKHWRDDESNQDMKHWFINSSNLRTLYNLFDEIDTIEKYEPLEQTFYAKIKGWDKVQDLDKSQSDDVYWNIWGQGGVLFLGNKTHTPSFHTTATMKQWNELGIDQSNAVFEKA